MARRDQVTLLIRGRNLLGRALTSARKSLGGFVRVARRMARRLLIGFAALTAAAVTFGVKAVQAYAKQQAAERGLAAALQAHGDNVEALMPIYMRVARRIQDMTGAADELTLALMAQLRQLGVHADQLEDAAKAHVALTHAGMGSGTAIRAIAAAMNGSYEMLTRYIPALRQATSEEEKAAIVHSFIAKNFEAATEDLMHTLSGRWREFKGRVGDAMEEIGRAITKTGAIQRLLKHASEAVVNFGQSVRDWVDSERFEKMRDAIQGIITAMARGTGEQRIELLQAGGRVLIAAFKVGGETALDILTRGAATVGRIIGTVAKDAFDIAKPPRWVREREMGREIRVRLRESPDLQRQLEAHLQFGRREQAEQLLTEIRDQIKLERVLQKAGIETGKVIEGKTQAQRELTAHMQAFHKAVSDINEEQAEAAAAREEEREQSRKEKDREAREQKRRDDAIMARLEKVRKKREEQEQIADEINSLMERRNRLEERYNQIIKSRQDEQRLQAIQNRIDQLQKRARDIMFHDAPDALRQQIADFIERRQRAEETAIDDQAIKAEWRALRDRIRAAEEGRGPGVRKADRERFRELELFRRAREQEAAVQREIEQQERLRDRLQDQQLHELIGIHHEVAVMREEHGRLLQAAGG